MIGHMRVMLDTFPEVLQMDYTHQTNQYVYTRQWARHNYQLLTVVAMDHFGQGYPIKYLLIETNSDRHMAAKCMDNFKRANEHWRFLRIIIVNKDMRETEVIRKKFTEAKVVLGHFHVIKWIHETIRKSKIYDVYEEVVLTQMKHCITNITYARVKEDYITHRDEFSSLACRDDRTALWQYFDTNWNKCREMWVMAFHADLPHVGNHTNKCHFTMHASLKVLLDYLRRKEEEYISTVEMSGTLKDVVYC
ncbi:Secreted protein [Phytophthora megakarya]|uniref:Secreted protein n=1 Tax=Phytophthora megakarya TaxID=4795 RepID=A0A225VFF2_9STRA|nr:Secreted protein [Phytophthora megakarya]